MPKDTSEIKRAGVQMKEEVFLEDASHDLPPHHIC